MAVHRQPLAGVEELDQQAERRTGVLEQCSTDERDRIRREELE
jgi:hypothetical protein